MRLKILIIDDEECIRDTFRVYLEELGHEVITAKGPYECDVFHDHDCPKDSPCGHVLFIDYFLSKTNGLDFIEEMTSRNCHLPAGNKFLMSGNIDLIDKEKAEKLSCKLLQKPIRFVELGKLLEDCMKNIDYLCHES